MKEYDLFIPLYYHDGRPVEPQPFQALQQQLFDQFGGLTFFPQPNEGFWTVAGVTYRDAIVIYRVLTSDAQEAPWDLLTQDPVLCDQIFIANQKFLIHRSRDVG